MKKIKSPHPALTVVFNEAIIDCEDAGYTYLLDGRDVGSVQLCGSSDFRRGGYGVTIEIPGRTNVFWTNYALSTKKAAEAHLLERLAFYGIL